VNGAVVGSTPAHGFEVLPTMSTTPADDGGSTVSEATKRKVRQLATALGVSENCFATRTDPDTGKEIIIVILGDSDHVTGRTKASVINQIYHSPATVVLHSTDEGDGTLRFTPANN
jgi:hypothetical protein